MDRLHHLLLVYATYVIATASPGPSNMAIMAVAMRQGRAAALVLALGVVTGSMFWAILAATGISALLASYASALFLLKLAGGAYLLYLAVRSARSALSSSAETARSAEATSIGSLYRRGLLLHLTNPKSILAWIAIMSLGLGPDAPWSTLPLIVIGCVALGVVIFGGYALVFSMAPMVRAYRAARRWIEGTLAVVFGYAGIRLLMSRA